MSSKLYYLFDTYEEALNISKELYNLIKPLQNQDGNETVDKVFLVIPHQNPKNPQTALAVDDKFEINFSTEANKQSYLNLFAGDVDINSTLNTLNKSTIKDLLPRSLKPYTYDELVTNGHLPKITEKSPK